MTAAALFFVIHGSSDRRSWFALQNLVALAQSRSNPSNLYIGGGCLEGSPLSLAQQLVEFATKAIAIGISEIAVLPMLLLAGVHVSEDIPAAVAIAQSQVQDQVTFRIMPHLGTDSQIPNILLQHFQKYQIQKVERIAGQQSPLFSKTEDGWVAAQGQILVSHGSRLVGANQVVEDLAKHCQAIAAYWGIEPKIETQVENLLAQGIKQINVLPYFLTEGGLTEAIAKKLEGYRDRAHIQQLPIPLSDEQILRMEMIVNMLR
jgi:sirohydrochlorin ferrochelatase